MRGEQTLVNAAQVLSHRPFDACSERLAPIPANAAVSSHNADDVYWSWRNCTEYDQCVLTKIEIAVCVLAARCYHRQMTVAIGFEAPSPAGYSPRRVWQRGRYL